MKTNNKLSVAVNAIDDHRAATAALMEVNRALINAGTICRALVHDADTIGGADLKKAARRLLRIINRMKDGPNTALWTDLSVIDAGVKAALAQTQQSSSAS
jgi:hypothetical protein